MRNMTKWLSAVLVALLLAGAGLPGAGVSKAAAAGRVWYVAAGAAGADDGTSWADAFTTLQDALDAATAGDEIWLKGGSYYPTKDIHGDDNPADPRTRTFQMKNGVAIYGGFKVGMADPGMADRGDATVLSGNIGDPADDADNAYHVFYHPAGTVLDSSAVLDGVTVYAGNAGGFDDHAHGGGFFNDGVTLTLRAVTINGNKALSAGGGMYNMNATVYVEDASIANNEAGIGGGGIALTRSTLTLVRTYVRENNATWVGGGISSLDSSVTAVGGEITANKAGADGGGIQFFGAGPQHALTLAHLSVSGNEARNWGGGLNTDKSTATLLDVDLISNKSGMNGGGWEADNTVITIIGGTFIGNSATSRGGALSVGGGSMQMSNAVVVTNAAGFGGGLYLQDTAPVLTNVTIAGNAATFAGGGLVSDNASPHIRNTIIWGNSSAINLTNAGSARYEYSLIEGSMPGGVWDAAIGTDGGNNDDADPLFTAPIAHGGAPAVGGNYRLKAEAPESPARDTGNSDFVADLPVDISGHIRIFGTGVDMGAYEAVSIPVLLTSTTELPDQRVAYGTALHDLPLPTEVTGKIGGPRTVQALVAWDHGRPAYNGAVPGAYTFTGHLLLPAPIIVWGGPITRTITVRNPSPPVSPPPPPTTEPPSTEPCTTEVPSFSDTAGHWAAADIHAAAATGLVNGYPDATFRPDERITRLQFATILVRALGLTGGGATIPFTDRADIPAWAAEAIGLAVQHDVVRGYEDGTFRPDATITRAEVAAMVASALGLALTDADPPFADAASIPEWARPYVSAVHAHGIMQGQGGNRFAPAAPTTRAEAAVLLLRVGRSLSD